VSPALVRDLDECVASHVLDTFVGLVHELEKLIDHGLEELPVRLEESGILANNVHDVTSNNSFVILSALHLGQSQEVLDNGDKEALLCLLVHRTGDGSDGPAEGVAVGP
jgi:hypothetical protein